MVSHDLHLVMSATDHVVCLNQHICCQGRPEQVTQIRPILIFSARPPPFIPIITTARTVFTVKFWMNRASISTESYSHD